MFKWILIIAILAAGTAAIWEFSDSLIPGRSSVSHESSSGTALIGGPFTLTDAQGKTFTEQDLKGGYHLVYFGFTYCPDICPTSLATIGRAIELLGEAGKAFTPVFITIDPERDTPDKIKTYAANFHPRLVALTGAPEQVKQAADAYKVYYRKSQQDDSMADYLMDHSGYIFVMDMEGNYVTHFSDFTDAAAMADSLRNILKRQAAGMSASE